MKYVEVSFILIVSYVTRGLYIRNIYVPTYEFEYFVSLCNAVIFAFM